MATHITHGVLVAGNISDMQVHVNDAQSMHYSWYRYSLPCHECTENKGKMSGHTQTSNCSL